MSDDEQRRIDREFTIIVACERWREIAPLLRRVYRIARPFIEDSA